MYEILNKTNDIPTGQVTWSKTYDINEGEWKAIYTHIPLKSHLISGTTMVSDKYWSQINYCSK